MGKPFIIFEGLNELKDNLEQYISQSGPDDLMLSDEMVDFSSYDKTKLLLIATVRSISNFDSDNFHFEWRHNSDNPFNIECIPKNELINIDFDNNLNILIHDERITTSPLIVMALIECIRRYYNSPDVIFYGNYDDSSDIYILRN